MGDRINCPKCDNELAEEQIGGERHTDYDRVRFSCNECGLVWTIGKPFVKNLEPLGGDIKIYVQECWECGKEFANTYDPMAGRPTHLCSSDCGDAYRTNSEDDA